MCSPTIRASIIYNLNSNPFLKIFQIIHALVDNTVSYELNPLYNHTLILFHGLFTIFTNCDISIPVVDA